MLYKHNVSLFTKIIIYFMIFLTKYIYIFSTPAKLLIKSYFIIRLLLHIKLVHFMKPYTSCFPF